MVVGRGGGVRPADRKLLGEMVSQVPVPLLRWGSRAIMEWPGAEEVAAPVHHIHGDHDWVIPLRCVKPTVVVPGGSHVLNLSNSDEVNGLLRRVVSGEW
jgi:pimeloyl-ACP methyl ester carboxylesterase